jgi:peptidoglycan/xylan/chitin deacetylase (PgdA/CDA1 family)
MTQLSIRSSLKGLKRATLQVAKNCHLFSVTRDSKWRRQRLLILCYHGIALEDEHLWRPALFMPAQLFEQRLAAIKHGGYCVLPLKESLERLRAGDLPPGSLALTFDDGTYDFYKQAFPLIKKHGFPVTVYQTTYYSDHQVPVFNLICSYMLWKRRGQLLDTGGELGLHSPLDLRTAVSRQDVVVKLLALTQNLSSLEKNGVARRLAELLQVDYSALVAKRILQIMNPAEIRQLAGEGIDFQLHTHRHRVPRDRDLFQNEIRQNRERLRDLTGQNPEHFCYPGGVNDPLFLPWLKEDGVVSATTCDRNFATRGHNPLLLPRLIDTSGLSQVEYESWLGGLGYFVSRKARGGQKFVPVDA